MKILWWDKTITAMYILKTSRRPPWKYNLGVLLDYTDPIKMITEMILLSINISHTYYTMYPFISLIIRYRRLTLSKYFRPFCLISEIIYLIIHLLITLPRVNNFNIKQKRHETFVLLYATKTKQDLGR